jgi:hypothetical protein
VQLVRLQQPAAEPGTLRRPDRARPVLAAVQSPGTLSRCGHLGLRLYTATPRYFTSLGGDSYHWWTTGATSIYSPTATGFRVFVFDSHGPVTPGDANARGWHINWQAPL